MSFYEDLHCPDCRKRSIVLTSHELLCRECGLVLQDRMMSEEPEWRHFQCEDDPSRVGLAEEQYISDRSVKDLMDLIHTRLQIPEAVCHSGGLIFKTIRQTFKGVHRVAVIAACIYYAQRDMQAGARTKVEFADALGIELCHMTRASVTTKEHLYQSESTKHLVQFRENKDDTLYRLIILVKDIPTNKIQEVKRVIYKLYDRIKSSKKDQVLASIQIDKLNVALIYMACNFAKIKVTMTHVAACCECSMATIIKTEALVKKCLSAS